MNYERTLGDSITDLPIKAASAENEVFVGLAKAKTSMRLKYEAEAQVILKKFGGLTAIKTELGLSQRKICQLLLVDPSSWSRWLQDESKTPPHILRALEWYMALMDKYPGFDINFWIHSTAKSASLAFEKTQKLEVELLAETIDLKKSIRLLEIQIESLSKKGNPDFYQMVPEVLPIKSRFAKITKLLFLILGLAIGGALLMRIINFGLF